MFVLSLKKCGKQEKIGVMEKIEAVSRSLCSNGQN
jgi:hypothetical protein